MGNATFKMTVFVGLIEWRCYHFCQTLYAFIEMEIMYENHTQAHRINRKLCVNMNNIYPLNMYVNCFYELYY